MLSKRALTSFLAHRVMSGNNIIAPKRKIKNVKSADYFSKLQTKFSE